jgi:hypothetical protein
VEKTNTDQVPLLREIIKKQKVPESTGATAAIAADAGKQNKVPIIKLDVNSQFGPLVQASKNT